MNNETYRDLDEKYCPKIDNPWAYFDKPPVFVKGEGSYLIDADGKKYLDMVAGYATVAFGHANKEFTDIACKQMNILTQTHNMITSNRIMLAKKLSKLAPINGPAKVYFDIGGSTAVEVARKIVSGYTKKHKLITFKTGFHGQSTGALSLMNSDKLREIFSIPKNCFLVDFPDYYRTEKTEAEVDKDVLNSIRSILESSNDISAFMMEPALGSAGYFFPSKNLVNKIRALCDEYKILLIFDEIQMGMGRFGTLFAADFFEVKPDLILLGKALGGGGIWPLSAVICRADVCDVLNVKTHTSTFCGNPLGCALGIATLDYIKENKICETVQETGQYFKDKLLKLKEKYDIIGQIEGTGLALGMEFVTDKKSKTPLLKGTKIIAETAAEQGLLLKFGGVKKNRIALSPPLNVSKSEIDEFVTIMEKVLEIAPIKEEIAVKTSSLN